MSKATLKFNLNDPDDRSEHKRAVNATNVYIALNEIANEVFRPARKHGYQDSKLNKMIELSGENEEGYNIVELAIGMLEDKFYEILSSRGIDLDD